MPSEMMPNTVAWGDILCELEKAEKPLTSAAVAKLLKQKTGKALKPTLDSEVQAGRIHSWGNNLYWAADRKAIARERLLRLTASQLLTATPLDKRAANETPKISPRVVGEVRRDLLREKLLREKAPLHGPKNRAKLIVNFRNPQPYLEEAIGRLLKDFEVVRSEQRIRALLASAEPQSAPALEPTAQAQPLPGPEVADVAERMFAAMNELAFAPGTTVTFYRLRQRPELASIAKEIFDNAALLLQHERRALLAVHDHAARLPKEQQDEFVTDGLGTYYVSIYAV
jgi:hypothetical protein